MSTKVSKTFPPLHPKLVAAVQPAGESQRCPEVVPACGTATCVLSLARYWTTPWRCSAPLVQNGEQGKDAFMPQPQLTAALTACSEHQPYVCGQTGLCFYRQK